MACALAAGALTASAAAPVPPDRALSYTERALARDFPQLTENDIETYAPAILEAAGKIEDAPIEDELGIPDGPAHWRERVDYVLSGIYYLGDDEAVSATVACRRPDDCFTQADESRYTSGLHFAAPGFETPQMETLPYTRVTFEEAVNDAIALRHYADSVANGESIGDEVGIWQEIRQALDAFSILGIIPAGESGKMPRAVNVRTQDEDPALRTYAAYACPEGSSDPVCEGHEGEITISRESLGDVSLYGTIDHELIHLQGILNETETETADVIVGATMGGAHEQSAARTLMRDALWTAMFIQNYPQLPLPASLDDIGAAAERYSQNLMSQNYERGDPTPAWLSGSGREKASYIVNNSLDEAVSERQAPALQEAIDTVYDDPSANDAQVFSYIAARWNGNTFYFVSNLQYLIAPYDMIERAGDGDGQVLIHRGDSGEEIRIDAGAALRLLDKARAGEGDE